MAKLIRKQSLWSRIKSYPFDLLLELNEQRALIDWDSYSETVALPLGAILTVVYFFVRLWQDHNTVKETKSKYFDYGGTPLRDSRYFGVEKSPIERLVSFVQVVVILVNVINTLLFMLKTKKYAVYNKDSIHHSASTRKVTRSSSRSIFAKLFSSSAPDDDVDSYWEINMWNPSKFSTYLFVSFPPFNVVFLYMSQSSFTNLFFLLQTSVVLYLVIIRGYLVLMEDKQVLFQETFDEYERKFVRPKLSVARREVAVDATRGPYDDEIGSVQYYTPGRTEKVFKTHDLKGNESVELFSDGEFTPVKRSATKPTDLRRSLYTPSARTRNSYALHHQQSPLSRKYSTRQ